MSAFDDVRSIVPRRVWDGITARAVHGERLTLALVELEPGAIAETHSHDHEQLGLVLRGSIRFRVGDKERELGPGETWEIPSNTPHRAVAGPDGASVLDLFSPPRSEWEQGKPGEPGPGRWLHNGDGALVGAGLVAGIAVHTRRQHVTKGRTRIRRRRDREPARRRALRSARRCGSHRPRRTRLRAGAARVGSRPGAAAHA